MVDEAEKFAEEDEKTHKEIELLNKGDSLAYQFDKLLNESGTNIDVSIKEQLERAIEKVRNAVQDKNFGILEMAIAELEKAAQEVSSELHASTQNEAAQATSTDDFNPSGFQGTGNTSEEDVIDVDYEVE